MKKIIFILLTVLSLGAAEVSAQSRKALKLNEIMVVNENNFIDDYGQRTAWIELFNSNFAPLEISSVYLTDDPNNTTKYPVPLGDVNTEIPTRQHVVFFADGMPSRGTFHVNFTLTPGQDNWIGIYDADGKTLIDSITVPASLTADQTYARIEDGKGTGAEAWEIRNGSNGKHITPSSANVIRDTNNKVAMFSEKDKNGFGMTIMAMCIVFSALLLLSICFYIISKIGANAAKRKKAEAHGTNPKETPREMLPDHDSGEVIAAIAMALHQHLDAHDKENTVLTFTKAKRSYSPWNSKIYTLRETPRR